MSALGALSVGIAETAAAQTGRPALEQHVVRQWTEPAPLAGTVHDLARTPDGYLWIATGFGLLRFDGLRFVQYDATTDTAFVGDEVKALAVDSTGELWVGTTTGLLRGGADRPFRRVPLPGGPRPQVQALLHAGGGIWVGLADQGVALVADGTVRLYGAEDGVPPGLVRALATARAGGIWVGTGQGLARIGAPAAPSDRLPLPLEGRDVRTILETPDDLWIGTTRGLFRFRDGRLERDPHPALSQTFITRLVRDERGDLWIGTSGQGLFLRAPNGAVERLSAAQVSSMDVRALLVGDEASPVFAGTVGSGLIALFPGDVLPFTSAHGLPEPIALAVLPAADGGIWSGTFGGGLAHIDPDGRVRVFGVDDGLPGPHVLSLARNRLGLWIGTRNGLARLRDGAIEPVTSPLLGRRPVIALHAGEDDRMWIGTPTGLFLFDDGRFRAFTTEDGLSADHVFWIRGTRDGDVWVATQGGGISVLRPDGAIDTIRAADGLGSDVVYVLHEDTAGTMWAGTSAGLSRIAGDSIVNLTRRHGLHDDVVYALIEDPLGYLWMSGNKGLARVPLAQLDSVARGHAARLQPLVLTAADGMPSTEANGGVQPSAARDADGRLWFPTMQGLAVVDPRSLGRRLRAPQTHIEQILVVREPVSRADVRALPPLADHITIVYTAFDFIDAEAIEFRYRLAPYDENWIEVGPDRSADYTNLPPGDFRFEVQARQPHGPWGETAVLQMGIEPALYQRALFWVALALLLVAGALALHRGRMHALRQREAELLRLIGERDAADAERAIAEEQLRQAQKMDAIGRLAGGVAHDFNNLLTAMFGHVDLLRERCGKDDVAGQELDELQHSAERAASLTRQLLAFGRKQEWAPEVVRIEDVVLRAESLLRRSIGETLELRIQLHAPDAFVRADITQLEQVLLNLAINARHAMDGQGVITITTSWAQPIDETGAFPDSDSDENRSAPSVLLVVSDTGSGMDAATRTRIFEPFFTTKPEGSGTGLGLSTVYAIVQRHDGDIEVDSEPGRGATFRIRLPTVPPPATDPVQLELQEPDKGQPDGMASEHVLVVEDERPVRVLLRRLLERSGYRVTEAESGRDALRLWREDPSRFDVILTDLVMPDMGGREFAEHARADRPEIPVAFMSGYSLDEDAARQLPPPSVFVAKPFDHLLLTRRLRELLD